MLPKEHIWSETMSDDYKMLNHKSIISMYAGYAISFIVLIILFYGIYYLINIYNHEYLDYAKYVMIVLTFITFVYIIAAPHLYYHHYRYLVTNEKIDIRRGIIILRRILVPIERIHQVEITKGPINNALGLADIEVTTAGGKVRLEFLDNQDAEQIAEMLNDFIRSMIKDRGSSIEQQ